MVSSIKSLSHRMIFYIVRHYQAFFVVVPIFFFLLGILGFNVNENAYFYTLSTVAQTLAAILGIIGAFTIFRMSKLDSEKNELIEDLMQMAYVNDEVLIDSLSDSETISISSYDEVLKFSNKEEFVKNMDSLIIKIDESNNGEIQKFKSKIEDIKSIDKFKKEIHLGFDRPFTFGAIAIFLSIFMLPIGKIVYPTQSLETIFPFSLAYNFETLLQLKFFYLGIVLYFTFVSIQGSLVYLDKLFGLKYK